MLALYGIGGTALLVTSPTVAPTTGTAQPMLHVFAHCRAQDGLLPGGADQAQDATQECDQEEVWRAHRVNPI